MGGKPGPKPRHLIFAIIIIIGAAIFWVVNNANNYAKDELQRQGSSILKVPVDVGAVNISPLRSKVVVHDLAIKNPRGFTSDSALLVDRAEIAIKIKSLLEPVWVIDHINIDSAQLTVEQSGLIKTNLGSLLKQLPSSDHTRASRHVKSGDDEQQLVIKRFEFTGGRLRLVIPDQDERVVPLPDLILTDIGDGSRALTIAQAVEQILAPIIKLSLRTSVAEGLGLEGQAKQLLDKAKEVSVEILEQTNQEAKELLEKAKSMLDEVDKQEVD